MTSNDNQDESILKIKLMKSILSDKYEILYYLQAKIYTANPQTNWLYSELKGILFVCVEYSTKTGKLLLFKDQDYTIQFSFDFYKGFSEAYTVYNPLFHYFEVGTGFIGFKLNNLKKSEELSKLMKTLNESTLEKIANNKPTSKIYEVEENYKILIKALKKKLEQEYMFNKTNEITDKSALLNHMTIQKISQLLSFEDQNLVAHGSRSDIESLCGFVLDIEYTDDDGLRISDHRAYALNIYNNILQSRQLTGDKLSEENDESDEKKKSVYIDAVRHKVLNAKKEESNNKTTSNANVVPSNTKGIPDIPKVIAPTNTKGIPEVPKVISTNAKGIPAVPKIVSNTKGVPGVPKIPNIVPIQSIPVVVNIEQSKQSENSQADRLAEIQGRMNNLKKPEMVTQGDDDGNGGNNQSTVVSSTNTTNTLKPKLSMMDELKLRMTSKFGGNDNNKDTRPSITTEPPLLKADNSEQPSNLLRLYIYIY